VARSGRPARPPRFVVGTVLASLLVVAAGCGGGSSDEADELDAEDVTSGITVTSSAFDEDTAIPDRFTCAGDDVSPPLAWDGVPAGAEEVAVVVDDPDAPSGTYVHWVVTGLDPSTTSLEEGEVPADAVQADNSAGKAAWSGPCPPEGPAHHYRFTVYALDEASGVEDGARSGEALGVIQDKASARGRLTATFER
jgi:Raf kinase inhibitor-like YbhB/YbcL family protein